MIWLTAELPGAQGTLLSSAEDFVVDEVPSYTPSGAGEHLMVRIEKENLTTVEAAKRVARAAGLRDNAISWAGHKDRAARARQWLSLPWPVKSPLPDFGALSGPDLRVLELGRHNNKLRIGHQKGNRFTITIRQLGPDGLGRAQRILARLRETGVPNTFGPQRFGREGDNAERALAALRGGRWPNDRRLRSLFVSALQSKIFNRTLELRLADGRFFEALRGDIMQKHDTHGMFEALDAAVETPRVKALEISPTGLLPGARARRAAHDAGRYEEAAIAELELTEAEIAQLDDGTRRVLRFPLDPEASLVAGEAPDTMRLSVFLPSGAFATVLLGELMKPESGEVLRALPEG
ncbi:MAG: tRNA pseudouridine(13) synthase TruD [Myxococcota bacterium]